MRPISSGPRPQVTRRREQQGDCGGAEHDGKAAAEGNGDVADLDPDGDEPDDLAAVVGDGNHRAHRRPEGARVGLGERLPGQRWRDGSDEWLAELRQVGVGEAGAVGRHHGDEVGGGGRHDVHRVGLQLAARIAERERFLHKRAHGDRGGNGETALGSIRLDIGAGVGPE
jgi:hypothetical protein